VNIFILDFNPVVAAEYLCDKHMKMILETAQILCMVSWRYGVGAPYRPVRNKNHRCVVWAGESLENYYWTLAHGLAAAAQYRKRYGKIHSSERVIKWCVDNGGKPTVKGFTPFALAMPDKYKCSDAVKAYRDFYIGEKTFAKWNFTKKPWWYKENENGIHNRV